MTLANDVNGNKPGRRGSVLASTNRKGGAGKTTASHNLAGVWGQWGNRVLLVDLDTAHNLTTACGYPGERLLTGGSWLLNGMVEPWPIPTMPGCDLLPSGEKLRYGVEAMAKRVTGREKYIAKIVAPLRSSFDVIILDTEPDVDLSVTGAIAASSHVLLPCITKPQPVQGVVRSLGLVSDIQEDGDFDVSVLGVLPIAFKPAGMGPAVLNTLVSMAHDAGYTCYPPIPYSEHAGKETIDSVPTALAQRNSPIGKAYRRAAALIGSSLGLQVPPDVLADGEREWRDMVGTILGEEIPA